MVYTEKSVVFDPALIRKYDTAVPRYTSYPPATELRAFSVDDYALALGEASRSDLPLSLYCHIPFCRSACYYCGCNVVIAKGEKIADTYLDSLITEISQAAQLIGNSKPVVQMHWGGGTPNYLTLKQMERLRVALDAHFHFAPDAELSIEVNPASLDREMVFHLKQLGFNRISFGIQDFDLRVQRAVNRVQPEHRLFAAMDWIRAAGFSSVNVDLIYGLPFQTPETFVKTVQKTIDLAPDRIAVFNFAYVPWLKPLMLKFPVDALPSAREKLEILRGTIESLVENNYQFIGMDHFARPNDELAIAQRQGNLKRNFQGYTARGEAELLAFGVSSISTLGHSYIQNCKDLDAYHRAINSGLPPVEKGMRLNDDDRLRQDVVMEFMCHFQLRKADIEVRHGICFNTYFAQELEGLKPLEADGLVRLSAERILVSDTGRLLVRNIAAIFDAYSHPLREGRLSRAI